MVKALSPRVFISSRGHLPNNFINHLENALREDDIECFTEYHLFPIGDLKTLFKAIDDSKIALIIFSTLYLESVWCMEELVKIKEKVEKKELEVIPIVYEHDGQSRTDLPEWQKALNFVSRQKGLKFEDYRIEKDFIYNIVLEVKHLLAKREEETNIHTVSSSSNIFPETTEQPRMDPPTHVNVEPKVSPPQQHQVFISFRGKQLRNNFISHLVSALRRMKINVFIDRQEEKGQDISNLLKRIEDSRIAIVVFSCKYTESTWCLKEAEKIKELAAQGKLKVLPIFYKVSPENVKQLKGEFSDHFRDHEWYYRHEESVIKKWKESLLFIANKIGIEVDDRSDENNSITSIAKEIWRMVTGIPSATQTMESHANKGETSNGASCVS